MAKLVLGPPHYHDTFQTCQTRRVGVFILSNVPDVANGRLHPAEMCTCHTSHAHSPHTSRDASCGVCLGVRRVDCWSSWCVVHHTPMTPLKRVRRGERATSSCRDVHVPHVARTLPTRRTHTPHTRVEMHLVASVWDYRVVFFCRVGAWSTTRP